jgi:subtilisin family serine protease
MKYNGIRELIIIVKPEAGLRISHDPATATSMTRGDVTPLINLQEEGIKLKLLFGSSEERLKSILSQVPVAPIPNITVPDLSVFYQVDAPEDRLDELVESFRQMDFVEAAYIKPPAELPVFPVERVFSAPEAPLVSPDFISRQGYLEAAPGGIGADFAWQLDGGRGANIKIIDIEGAWHFTHEDLLQNQGGVVAGTPFTDLRSDNHGTAVVGVIGGDDNGFGITGIVPEANVRAISVSIGISAAITTAANMLDPGDIILIEQHYPGPRFNFQAREDQLGYIPVQYWPDTYAAITYATVVKGVIVVEAAGNGAEDLDDPLYSLTQLGFPPFWSPFNRGFGDNAAILVGAGSPPPGTHGRDHGPDRSRLEFSNFGSCVDVQGWGREVTTCGYGDLQGGFDQNFWYTDTFAGTSSASPIIVGAIACIQGILKAQGKPLLTPITARQVLGNTGSAQLAAPGRPSSQNIGSRPNLFLAIAGL